LWLLRLGLCHCKVISSDQTEDKSIELRKLSLSHDSQAYSPAMTTNCCRACWIEDRQCCIALCGSAALCPDGKMNEKIGKWRDARRTVATEKVEQVLSSFFSNSFHLHRINTPAHRLPMIPLEDGYSLPVAAPVDLSPYDLCVQLQIRLKDCGRTNRSSDRCCNRACTWAGSSGGGPLFGIWSGTAIAALMFQGK